MLLENKKLNLKFQQLQSDRDALKKKIEKMSKMRKVFDVNSKNCVRCGKDFNDKENFRWSCRTHIKEWDENQEVYWCCGKKNQRAPGCKV